MFRILDLFLDLFIEFQLTLRKSVLNAIRLVSCITLLWIVIFWCSLWIFDGEHRETNTGKWSDTSLLMIPFLSFNEVSKIKFVNILSIKETVLDVTVVSFVINGMQPWAKIPLENVQISKFSLYFKQFRLKILATNHQFILCVSLFKSIF